LLIESRIKGIESKVFKKDFSGANLDFAWVSRMVTITNCAILRVLEEVLRKKRLPYLDLMVPVNQDASYMRVQVCNV